MHMISDVDEGPPGCCRFSLANFLSQEMHRKEIFDSGAETEIDDNRSPSRLFGQACAQPVLYDAVIPFVSRHHAIPVRIWDSKDVLKDLLEIRCTWLSANEMLVKLVKPEPRPALLLLIHKSSTSKSSSVSFSKVNAVFINLGDLKEKTLTNQNLDAQIIIMISVEVGCSIRWPLGRDVESQKRYAELSKEYSLTYLHSPITLKSLYCLNAGECPN
ncbi:hypothetical protein Tco_1121521 [Tanacetum coccineum]|uniref:Uncharacterized protein n=1 Tax=Tanacetum coccineum TaxID=301880 RepID=A0ABQ5IYX1_9ASTR